MGYSELRSEVVMSAVKDYKRMIKVCKKKKISNPKEYLKNYKYGESDISISSILRWGLDAEKFLSDKSALLIFTNIDGQKIMEHIRETA